MNWAYEWGCFEGEQEAEEALGTGRLPDCARIFIIAGAKPVGNIDIVS